MKALILAGGKGTRLKPLTNTITKQLLPIANRPILFYAIDQIIEAGFNDLGFIISPETGASVKEAVGDGSRWNAKITYILQPEPLGLAHAVKTAQDFLGDSPFIMHLGDTLIQANLTPFVAQFKNIKPDALILLQEAQNTFVLRKVGVVQLNEKGEVISLEEKPEKPKDKFALVGVYFFSSKIHQAITHLKPSWRGELEITDAIQELINRGDKVQAHILEGWWLDTGKKDDLLEANRAILDRFLKQSVQGQVDTKSSIVGRVEIRKGTKVEDSTIRGPVSIAEDCLIRNSFIGPFTSIGRGTEIEDSYIEHSIILGICHIMNVKRLIDSIIGSEVNLVHSEGKPDTLRFFIGDNAKIEF